MKREDTLIIEDVLLRSCFGSNPKLATDYGVSEVTIGFQRNKKGKELVDFMSYDPKKDVFKCYEIKVTMADFHSTAKKSWYGNYNYLVLSTELFKQQSLEKWKEQIPKHVGIIVVDPETKNKTTEKRSMRVDISDDTKDMLTTSLLRSMFYKMQK